MGGGYYDRDDDVQASTSSNVPASGSSNASSSASASASVVGKTTSMNPGLDPKRYANEKMVCDKGDPIVFALDVTGSMGEWTKIIYDKMPMFYGQIMMQKYLEDPSISFCAIGDAKTDQAPLQVSDFGQGKEIDQLIAKMWLEGNGGGNEHESYEMAGYFYNYHSAFSNARRPFFFVTGDEGFWETTTKQMVERVMGFSPEKDYPGDQIWKDLMTKFNVFHIKKAYYSGSEAKINKQWCHALGVERVLHITNPKACIDVMLGAICLTSGTRSLKDYIKDMQIREQTKERIEEVTKALTPYWEALKNKKIIPVEATNEAVATKAKSKKDFSDLKEVAEKLLSMSLQTDEEKEYVNGLKDLSKEKAGQLPEEFICPITGELFYDPVIAADQVTYERSAIGAWFTSKDTSPTTDEKLASKDLIPNQVLKNLIKQLYQSNK